MDIKDWRSRVENKLDLIKEENNKQNIMLGKMEVLFEKNTEILEEHQRRSLASENRLDIVEQAVEQTEKKIVSHLSFIKGAIWVLGGLASLIGIALTIKRLLI
jgi:hypothetical protein